MKRILLVLVLAALVAVIASMLSDARREAVQIGFIASLTGPQAEIARESCDGATLAIDECNQAGGILGRPVRLLIRNDEDDPRAFAIGLDELARQNVRAVIGPSSPAMAALAVSEANRRGLLLLSPTIGVDRDSPRDSRVPSVYPSAFSVAEQITGYMSRHKLLRPAIVMDTGCAPPGMMSSLQRSIPFASESIVCTTQYNSSSGVVITDLIDGVLATRPDCVVVFGTPRDTAYFLQHLRRRNASIPVITGEASATSTLTSIAGLAAEGLVVVQTNSSGSTPGRYLRFRNRFLERYQREPGSAAVHGYDSARILLTLISRGTDAPLRRSTFTGASFEGLQGRILFTDNGDVRRELSCAIIRDGVIRTVE